MAGGTAEQSGTAEQRTLPVRCFTARGQQRPPTHSLALWGTTEGVDGRCTDMDNGTVAGDRASSGELTRDREQKQRVRRSTTVLGRHCAWPPLCSAATVLGRHCAWPPLCSAATVLGRHCAWLSATHFPPLHKHTRAHSRAARVPRAGLRACASAVVRRLPVVGRSTRCSAGPPPGPSARPTPSLSRAPVRKTWAALSFDGPNHLGFWFTARIASLPRSLRRACQGLPLKAGSSVGCTPARPHVRVSTDVYTNPVDREERWMQRGSQTSGAWRGSNQRDARIVGGLDRVDHLFELSDSLTSRCGPRCSATDWLQLVTLPALKR